MNRWRRFEEDPALLLEPQHSQRYLQIQREAPNLLWLYVLMADAGIHLRKGEVVAVMKERLLQERALKPAAWRYVANGHILDFWVVLEASDPNDEPLGQWNLLVSWLQILAGVRLEGGHLPVHLQQLFLNDSLLVVADAQGVEIQLRGAWMGFNTLRSLLNEARSRLSLGTFDPFIESELPVVITWIAATDPYIDRNQQRSGWRCLLRNAEAWRKEIKDRPLAEKQSWHSDLDLPICGDWHIDSITNAWDLHRLSLTQRHCADRFLDGCLAGIERIFTISDNANKICATIRLSRIESTWGLTEVRGFANADVSDDLQELSREFAVCYTDQWQKTTGITTAM